MAKPFVVKESLRAQKRKYSLQFLVDTGASGFSFIDRFIAYKICDFLGIQPITMPKPKTLREYDGIIAKREITQMIFPSLSLKQNNHKEPSLPIFIADLGDYRAILGKL